MHAFQAGPCARTRGHTDAVSGTGLVRVTRQCALVCGCEYGV